MKIYDAKDDYHEKDTYLWGFWCDDVNWKGLMYQGLYTHVLLNDEVYPISKHGPAPRLGVVIPYRIV